MNIILLTSTHTPNIKNQSIAKWNINYNDYFFFASKLQSKKVEYKILKLCQKDNLNFDRFFDAPCFLVVVCPPQFIEHEGRCYHQTNFVGNYDEIAEYCSTTSWKGGGYMVMPKDWSQFQFVTALAYPYVFFSWTVSEVSGFQLDIVSLRVCLVL